MQLMQPHHQLPESVRILKIYEDCSDFTEENLHYTHAF